MPSIRVSLMAGECGRLSRFLHNILDHAKIEQKAKVYCFRNMDVGQLVGDILKLNKDRLQSLGFCVTQHIPKKASWLNIDPDAVKQALTNLLDNAIKYSQDKREVNIQLIEKNRRIEIHMQDKGIGMDESEQDKVFNGFYRTEEAHKMNPKGVGIGLKIVNHIMEAHGGQILVESQKNRGSTFILVFPKS